MLINSRLLTVLITILRKVVRPKIGNREKHLGKHKKCPKKQWKHFEKRGNVRGNGGKHVGNCHLRGFLRYLGTSFQAQYRRNNLRMSGNLHCFSRTFFFVKWSEISACSKMAEALNAHALGFILPDTLRYTWVYSAANF